MIIVGLDYGERRIGVAVSDELEIAAHAQPPIERDGSELQRIADLVDAREADRIVVGMPFRMDGTEGTQARKVRGFIKALKRRLRGVEVVTVDERLTTAQAERVLSAMKARRRVRKRAIDGLAAQIVLQRHLDQRAVQRRREEP